MSLVTFLIMFLPRSRQLVAMGKEEMYVDQVQDPQCHYNQVKIIRGSNDIREKKGMNNLGLTTSIEYQSPTMQH